MARLCDVPGSGVPFAPDRHRSPPPAVRFWRRVDTSSGIFACWEWQGASRDRDGYGHFRPGRGRAAVPASRYAWELTNGAVPSGLFVCHTCDNPPCCNPAHLFLGTNAENQRDAVAKGRHGKPRGQALAEMALVFPVLCALFLAIIEAGALGWHVIAWQQLAGAIAQAVPATGALPVWWATEAAFARCGGATALLDASSDPHRVVLTCTHSPWAVNGFEPVATLTAYVPSPSASPEPTEVPTEEP